MKRRSLLGWLLGAPVAAAVVPEVVAKPVVRGSPYGFIGRYTAEGVEVFRYEWGELTEHQKMQLEAKSKNFEANIIDIWEERDRHDYLIGGSELVHPNSD